MDMQQLERVLSEIYRLRLVGSDRDCTFVWGVLGSCDCDVEVSEVVWVGFCCDAWGWVLEETFGFNDDTAGEGHGISGLGLGAVRVGVWDGLLGEVGVVCVEVYSFSLEVGGFQCQY